MPDAKVQVAIDNWGPRFVEQGVPLGDFSSITAAIDSWDQWCATHDIPQMRAAQDRAVECHRRALPNLDPPAPLVLLTG